MFITKNNKKFIWFWSLNLGYKLCSTLTLKLWHRERTLKLELSRDPGIGTLESVYSFIFNSVFVSWQCWFQFGVILVEYLQWSHSRLKMNKCTTGCSIYVLWHKEIQKIIIIIIIICYLLQNISPSPLLNVSVFCDKSSCSLFWLQYAMWFWIQYISITKIINLAW